MNSYNFAAQNSSRASDRYSRTVHIAEPANGVFLDACERQIACQIEKLRNPAFGGSARVEAREYLAGLTVAYEEAAGRPFTLEDAA